LKLSRQLAEDLCCAWQQGLNAQAQKHSAKLKQHADPPKQHTGQPQGGQHSRHTGGKTMQKPYPLLRNVLVNELSVSSDFWPACQTPLLATRLPFPQRAAPSTLSKALLVLLVLIIHPLFLRPACSAAQRRRRTASWCPGRPATCVQPQPLKLRCLPPRLQLVAFLRAAQYT